MINPNEAPEGCIAKEGRDIKRHNRCVDCAFNCDLSICIVSECDAEYRDDGVNVFFVKVKK